ncbi:ATP-binding cassette domain-containing protein [Butyrivibrio sp. VCD2006]|uniref:ATP-binding cassette domain-containing protein n=1 Tax=Butyrivibrio sp. VCD2006 TaxID=1280664 RepID=UPI000404BD7C|nr:ATP-binding cassette domain-containing protein [Butyrivibrio sp. VCD2006]
MNAEDKSKKLHYHHIKVPVVLQMEYVECGAASLCMILAYYGKYVPLEQVRKDCNVSRDGSKASLILAAAEHYGLQGDGYRYSVESCMTKVKMPAIIHWNMSHFVVLRGFGKNKAYLNDPGRGEITVSMEEFNRSFTGIVLEFSPTEKFEKGGKRPGVLASLLSWMKQSKDGVAFVLLNALIIAMIGLLVPAFQRMFLDDQLDGYHRTGGLLIYLLIFGAGFMELAADSLKELYNYKIKGRFGVRANMAFFKHLLELPMDFFMQRSPGELIGRLTLNSTITQSLFDKLVPVLVQMLMAVLYFLAMMKSNIGLAILATFLVLLNIFVTRFASASTVRYMQQRLNSSMQMDAVMVSGIDMIETIKTSGVAGGYFARWASWQAKVNTGKTKENLTASILVGFSLFIQDLTGALILMFCALLIMKGYMTVGVLLAFQTLATKLAEPAKNISETIKSTKELTTSINKLEDVIRYEKEDTFKEKFILDGEEQIILSGDIEIKNLTFGYSKAVDPLFENLNISIKKGESIAFVGSSGSGKSTMAKLLTGLVHPWSGEILFDGTPINDIDSAVYHASVAMVNQECAIFHDSIRNNISLWDRTIMDGEITDAAEEAAIHHDILNMSGGYEHRVSSGGINLSGGQRQRISIARALALNPSILILDEATSALDAMTEHHVMKSIQSRKITTIIVAHRLSTVRSCDRIIVFDHGKIVEAGTHEELLDKKGKYYELVSMV